MAVENQLGRDTFLDIVKLLTQRGEAKAGLSTYYIKFRHGVATFNDMLIRVDKLQYKADKLDSILHRCKQLKEKWKKIIEFLTWEYRKRHLLLANEDRLLCCAYALGGNCTHEHQSNCCTACSSCFSFFQAKVQPFMKDVETSVVTSHKTEATSMVTGIPKLAECVIHYASHRLRANVQFAATRSIYDSMKADPSIVLMLPDHKQKVLQMRYREGQVEYYGKKGMSLLGMMEVRWKVDGDDSGFEYSFVDYVVKGYTSQDHVQVAAVE